MVVRDQYSSLFCRSVIDAEKSLTPLPPRALSALSKPSTKTASGLSFRRRRRRASTRLETPNRRTATVPSSSSRRRRRRVRQVSATPPRPDTLRRRVRFTPSTELRREPESGSSRRFRDGIRTDPCLCRNSTTPSARRSRTGRRQIRKRRRMGQEQIILTPG